MRHCSKSVHVCRLHVPDIIWSKSYHTTAGLIMRLSIDLKFGYLVWVLRKLNPLSLNAQQNGCVASQVIHMSVIGACWIHTLKYHAFFVKMWWIGLKKLEIGSLNLQWIDCRSLLLTVKVGNGVEPLLVLKTGLAFLFTEETFSNRQTTP